MAEKIIVEGMSCGHCKAAVEKAVKAIPGIKDARVNLEAKELEYDSLDGSKPVAREVVVAAIEDLGYTPKA